MYTHIIYTYMQIYTNMHIDTCTYMYTVIATHMHIKVKDTNTHIDRYTHIHTYTQIYWYTQTCTQIYPHIHICEDINTSTHISTYTHIHTKTCAHTNMCVYTYMVSRRPWREKWNWNSIVKANGVEAKKKEKMKLNPYLSTEYWLLHFQHIFQEPAMCLALGRVACLKWQHT